MKYLKQVLVILGISLLGEVLKYFLPLPVPASIYGMVLLFAGLMSGMIKLEQVRDAGMFLVEIMPLMFIPAGVGLMESWGFLQEILLPVAVITLVVLVAVMAVSGRVTQAMMKRTGRKEPKDE